MTPVRVAVLVAALAVAQAQAQDEPKITIVHPESKAELSGTTEVRAKAEGFNPSDVYVGVGGAEWRPMAKNEATGEWVGSIETTMVPNGSHLLLIVTTNRKVRAATQVSVENPLQIFFADLHSHSGYSDGTLTPTAAHDYARDVAKLDVFCLTDHLESVSDAEWLDMREAAFDANVDGEFVAFPGLEWTKKWGHLNIYDPKQRRWPKDPQEFYKAAAEYEVVTKFNHPGAGAESHAGLAYSEVGDKTVQMMEVRRPDEQVAFIRALNNGWHIAPDGSTDTHGPNWGNIKSWTGIYAPGLSPQNILDALANRRCYSTLDRNCRLMFRVNGASPGDIVEAPAQKVKANVEVTDPDATDAIAKIELFEDGNIVEVDEPNEASRTWNPVREPEPGKHYYFVKVTQADGNLLWSAPIWVTVAQQ